MSDTAQEQPPKTDTPSGQTQPEEVPNDSNVKKDAKAKDGKPADKKVSKSGLVACGKGIEIDPQKPLPQYDCGPIKAYRAVAKKASQEIFALVCENQLTPRRTALNVYQSIINQNMSVLVHSGVIFWPLANQERFVLIYADNHGERFASPDKIQAGGMKQEVILEKILPGLVSLLLDFRDKDFVHGNIRADNLYTKNINSPSKITLGECLCAPAGALQPAVYEPIERAMADPLARGVGTQADDMYALGVTLAVMMRVNDPLEGMDDAQIVKQKINFGSYGAITGKDRFTGSILEVLRGLLNDDASVRWTIDDIVTWMDGRRLTPQQSTKKIVAPRPIRLGGEKYLSPVILAMDLDLNPTEARRIIEEGELKNWFVRALETPDLYELVENAVALSKAFGEGAGYEERLVANVSISIDPTAPLRYKGLRMHPDGVGAALTKAFLTGQDLNAYAEIFSQGMVMNWIKSQDNPKLDIPGLIKKFDACKSLSKQPKIGYGLERCVYTLNRETHCLSDVLKSYCVLTPEDVLDAFEELCGQKKNVPTLFLDRHIAAFLYMKEPKVIESFLPEINSDEYYKKILGNIRCFGAIQKRYQMGAFPNIAMAFSERLHAIYKRYHDRKVRDALKENVEIFAQKGDIVRIAALLDNPELFQKDMGKFKDAMREYDSLKKEKGKLVAKLANKDNFGTATGQEVAAVAASVLAAFIILVIGFLYLSDQGIF